MNIFKFKYYSFSTKIFLIFVIFLLIFLVVRSLLVIPKIETKSFNNELNYITKSLTVAKDQLKIISKTFKMQSSFERQLIKEQIKNELENILANINIQNQKKLLTKFRKNTIINQCAYKININTFQFMQNKNNISFEKNDLTILNKWQTYKSTNKTKKHNYNNYYFYNYKDKDSHTTISIGCDKYNLNPHHNNFIENLKQNIHKNSLIDSELKSTKIAFFWLNPNLNLKSNEVLLEKNYDKKKEKYHIAKLSTVRNIPTGDLSISKIYNALDKEPIEHIFNGVTLITWVMNLSIDTNTDKAPFLLIYTINKNELLEKNEVKILFLLPETLVAITISFILILLLFRRIFKNINTITQTAIKINNGKINSRCNVKGDDDIGILGKSFDSMLDSFENNIKSLDIKVEEKTKKIQQSLEEKEILLQEIHHRVKNNLALTISLIELEENNIEDNKTKKVLLNIQERIYTMELLHRMLYQSSNFNKISFKKYITNLCTTISSSYDRNKNVKIDIDIEEFDVNIETAMPYGLILNELITNAFKYAFQNHDHPHLYIIAILAQEQITLTVKDNGKGLKQDFTKIVQNTLGLKLINMIVKYQLFGDITYQYKNGANFIINGCIKK